MIHSDAILAAMQALWSYSKETIKPIAEHFKNLDQTYEYLSLMDSEGVNNPKECWEEFCNQNDIEHEITNNPFKS